MFSRGQGGKREVCSFLSTETHPVGAVTFVGPPAESRVAAQSQESEGAVYWLGLGTTVLEDFACFCPEPTGTHAFISGPAGLASSHPPGPKSKVQGLGFGRTEIKEERGWRGGLTPGGTE